MEQKVLVELFAFTDPVCTWCWGSEPVLRKLEMWYGDQLRIRPVMGGLVEDIRGFYDRANDIGGDPEQSNAQIARHWLEASQRHGMPVEIKGFRLFSADTISTYPQNIAYKAAVLTKPALASRYLRRMREASAAEARETGRQEVLIELATEVGLDIAAFIGHLSDGSAEKAFMEDLKLTRQYHARGFPTFILRHNHKELKLNGYQNFKSIEAVIETLTAGKASGQPPEKTSQAILKFISKYGRVAPVEIMTVFDLTKSELDTATALLEKEKNIRVVTAGNGCFYEPHSTGLVCNSETGVCEI